MGSTNQFRAKSSNYNKFPASSVSLIPEGKSSYHDSCIPKEVKERARSAPARTRHPRDYSLCNHVTEELIWNERIRKERNLQGNWDSKYHFLLEFDQLGNPRQRRIPNQSNTSVYSINFPQTVNSQIGHRVRSAPAQRMQSLERSLHQGKRRNSDLVYCD